MGFITATLRPDLAKRPECFACQRLDYIRRTRTSVALTPESSVCPDSSRYSLYIALRRSVPRIDQLVHRAQVMLRRPTTERTPASSPWNLAEADPPEACGPSAGLHYHGPTGAVLYPAYKFSRFRIDSAPGIAAIFRTRLWRQLRFARRRQAVPSTEFAAQAGVAVFTPVSIIRARNHLQTAAQLPFPATFRDGWRFARI